MTKQQKFVQGVQFISSIYKGRLNGQTFDRQSLMGTVSIFVKLGFRHVLNEGTLAVLQCNKEGILQTIKIGRQDDHSFFEHTVTEQTSLQF